MRGDFSSTSQLGRVGIEYADDFKRPGKLRLVEVRISTRAGKTSNVYESFDPLCQQNLIKLLGRPRRVAHCPDTTQTIFHISFQISHWSSPFASVLLSEFPMIDDR